MLAFGVFLVAGLVVVPASKQIGLLQQAHADKGGMPNSHSAGHGRERAHFWNPKQ